MKRTFERITFMLIGAVIALFAYIIGSIDHDVEAQGQNELTCETLIASKGIVVGNPKEGMVYIVVDKKQLVIAIYGKSDPKTRAIYEQIQMKIDNGISSITLVDSEGSRSIHTFGKILTLKNKE